MRVIADLHIHSKYSRATSQEMNIETITRFAQIKGLTVVGTGDFTHPKWLQELKFSLVEAPDTGLYRPAVNPKTGIYFTVTTEVSTIFEFQGKTRKIHHVILTPSVELAAQINDRLAKYGNLAADGRPTLSMTAPELVENVMNVSKDNEIFPSHAWTPWFSIFGAFSGFDKFEDCYQDMTKYIHALETGLSSDPPMNWRLSSLDRFALVSNSDSHSAWPWRIGREANAFELSKPSYYDIVDAIRSKDAKRFKFTIETDPAYGKYHWTGHRACNISLSPQEAAKLGNICPKCHRRLTKGVEQRIEELADRPEGYQPKGAIPFIHLLPLHEIIGAVLGIDQISSKQVWEIYNSIVQKFGDEYKALIDASREELSKIVDPKIADAIVRVREEKVKVIPGYDGVYGKLMVFSEKEPVTQKTAKKQKDLEDFI